MSSIVCILTLEDYMPHVSDLLLAEQREAVGKISRGWIARMRRRVKPAWAAPIIQQAWRAFSQRRIFKYYRDLIKFR
eukprot:scaffold663525_cov62-Prasinocladus_malaysianus.AAC.1